MSSHYLSKPCFLDEKQQRACKLYMHATATTRSHMRRKEGKMRCTMPQGGRTLPCLTAPSLSLNTQPRRTCIIALRSYVKPA